MMKQLGQDPSDAELKELIRSVDENGGACDPSIATRVNTRGRGGTEALAGSAAPDRVPTTQSPSVRFPADGQIQMREFVKLFCMASDNKSTTSPLQVNDTFSAFGGDPRNNDSSVTPEDLCAKMMEQFDLEIDCKTAFGKADNSCGITKHDFEKLLQPQQTPVDADGKRITSRRGGVQLPPPPPLPL